MKCPSARNCSFATGNGLCFRREDNRCWRMPIGCCVLLTRHAPLCRGNRLLACFGSALWKARALAGCLSWLRSSTIRIRVRLELQTGTNDALTDAVRERSLDAAFVAEALSDGFFASLPRFREKLVLISSVRHPPITCPRDVTDDSIIAFPNGCAYRRILERWLGRKNMTTFRVLELSSYHAIVVCVASGAGIALLPESVLDVVNSKWLTRHKLPAVFANIITPLIWRAKEASPAITALQGLLTKPKRSVAG